MDGAAGLETTRMMSLVVVSGLLGWMGALWRGPEFKACIKTGANWLIWRPLPFGLLPAVFLALGLGILAQIAGMSMILAWTGDLPVTLMYLISIATFHVPATVMAMAWFQRSRIPLEQGLGLETRRGWPELAAGFGGYAMAFPLVVTASALTLLLFDFAGWEMTLQPAVLDLKQISHPMEWLMIFLLVVVVGPFCEEVMFRGVLFPWLAHRIGIPGGLLLHSAVFAAVHGHAGTLIPLFVLSIFLGLLFMARRNLMAAFWMHAVFNAVSLMNMMMQSGVNSG
jgi:membrane protease YdiL (CAAX protease family)